MTKEKTVPKTHKAHRTPTEKPAEPKMIEGRGNYSEGIGRRKVAIARVRLVSGSGKMVVLGKAGERSVEQYFPFLRLREIVFAPLRRLKLDKAFDVSIRVRGGGSNAQAEAVSLGIARALVIANATLKDQLRAYGYLTRDARMVERKKYGLKKARKAPQWSKR